MHLDLSPLITAQTLMRLNALVLSERPSVQRIFWDDWVFQQENRHMQIHEMQACAQYLSSCGCLLASLAFGLYCSRYYQTQGAIISDDAAAYYLNLSFKRIHQERGELLHWLIVNKAHCYLPFHENNFWKRACVAFLHHRLAHGINRREAVIDFAISFVYKDSPKKS